MSTGRRPDPRRKKSATIHGTYLKVPNGGKEVGYLAGELYGCYGHRTHAHQPCLHDLTEGALTCQYCAAGMVPDWRGYVPLWDRDYTLRYVLIGEEYYESVNMIPHRAQIVVTRAKNPISPLVIRAGELVLTRGLPDREPWASEVDMSALCRVLWKCGALDAWWALTQAKQLPGVGSSPPLSPAKFSPMMRAAAKRVNGLTEPKTINEVFVEAIRRGDAPPEPKPNGKHKAKRE